MLSDRDHEALRGIHDRLAAHDPAWVQRFTVQTDRLERAPRPRWQETLYIVGTELAAIVGVLLLVVGAPGPGVLFIAAAIALGCAMTRRSNRKPSS